MEIQTRLVPLEDLSVIVELYNQIFRPSRDVAFFERRYRGRHNILQMLATCGEKTLGFFLGYETKPSTFQAWFYGVLPDARRRGVASQLMEAAHRWANEQGYRTFRVECYNSHRPMLHLSIALGYDVIGLRWDSDRKENLVLFEKNLSGQR